MSVITPYNIRVIDKVVGLDQENLNIVTGYNVRTKCDLHVHIVF